MRPSRREFLNWVSAGGITLSLSRLGVGGSRRLPAARVPSGARELEPGRQRRGPGRWHGQGHRRKTLRIRFPCGRPSGLAGQYLARDADPRAGRDTRLSRNGSCAAWRRDEAVSRSDCCRSRQDRHPRSRILHRRPVLSGRQDTALSGAAGRAVDLRDVRRLRSGARRLARWNVRAVRRGNRPRRDAELWRLSFYARGGCNAGCA